MPIDSPAALVEEFKKSGEFDRLRRELLAQFQQESYAALKARVEEIARQRLATDSRLQYQPTDVAIKELIQEVERYPIVERAVSEGRIFSDSEFLANVQSSVQRILQEDRKKRASSSPAVMAGNLDHEEPKLEKVEASKNDQKNKVPDTLLMNGVGLINNCPPSTASTKFNNEESGKLNTAISQPETRQKSSEAAMGGTTVPYSNTPRPTSSNMNLDMPGE